MGIMTMYTQGDLGLSLPEAWEEWWLPRRPLCCDHYDEQKRRSRQDALSYRMVEPNPSALSNLLVVDIDDEQAEETAIWGHAGMLPNVLTINPANGHAHAVWVLTYPVCRTNAARLKPLKLARVVTEGLRRSCDGDAAYTGHLTKNPLHPAWEAEILTTDTYDLQHLAHVLEDAGDMPPRSWTRTKRARTQGIGRNCTIFDAARTAAYRYVRRLPDRSEASSEALREYVRRTCHEINAAEFAADPLPVREVNDIARSIHKWIVTESNMWRDGAAVMAATFTLMQSARGRKGGQASGQARRSKRDDLVKEVLSL